MQSFTIHPFASPWDVTALRAEIRAYLGVHMPRGDVVRRAISWAVRDPAFSRALAQAGYAGMIWPKRYGGHERHPLERYAVLEELLAAGASAWRARDRRSADRTIVAALWVLESLAVCLRTG